MPQTCDGEMVARCVSTWQTLDSNYAIVKVLFKPDAKLKALRKKLYRARYAAYRAYEDEKDAWAVGGQTGTKFRGLTATTP